MHNKVKDSIILVTGGAGFIGSYVIEELIPLQPKKIIIIDNLIRGGNANMKNFINNPLIEFHEGDIRDLDLLEKCIAGADYVFHMAALRINACAANPREGFEVMLKSTFEVASLCAKHKVKKVIYSSSASVYGLAQHFPTPETDNPYNNQTFYGAAKMWGEQLFRSFKFMYGLDYVALTLFQCLWSPDGYRWKVYRSHDQMAGLHPRWKKSADLRRWIYDHGFCICKGYCQSEYCCSAGGCN